MKIPPSPSSPPSLLGATAYEGRRGGRAVTQGALAGWLGGLALSKATEEPVATGSHSRSGPVRLLRTLGPDSVVSARDDRTSEASTEPVRVRRRHCQGHRTPSTRHDIDGEATSNAKIAAGPKNHATAHTPSTTRHDINASFVRQGE